MRGLLLLLLLLLPMPATDPQCQPPVARAQPCLVHAPKATPRQAPTACTATTPHAPKAAH
eukprot:439600-Prymnesium_polylepis.1